MSDPTSDPTSSQGPRDPAPEPHPTVDDVLEVDDDALPRHSRRDPSRGMPEHPDDEELNLATEHERVDAGVADFAPDDVPAATDPDLEGTSVEAQEAEQGQRQSEVHDYTADGHADQELVEELEREDDRGTSD